MVGDSRLGRGGMSIHGSGEIGMDGFLYCSIRLSRTHHGLLRAEQSSHPASC